jgi:hypothetical protein
MPTGTVSKVRQIIKAQELIEKLQINALDDNAEPLHQNKLHAIKILLNKAIPDLKAVEHSGSIDSEQTNVHRVTFRNRK